MFPKGTFILVVYMSHVQPQRLKPILCNRLLSFFLLDSHKKVHTQFSFLCSSGQGEAGGGRGPFLYCSCWIQSTVHVFAFLIHQLENKANISIDQGIKTDNKLPPMYHLLGFPVTFQLTLHESNLTVAKQSLVQGMCYNIMN